MIAYFAQRGFVANVIMFGCMLLAVVLWGKIGKEEYPDFEMQWVRASIAYPGASAEDVELFVVKPVEEQLKGVSGLKEVTVNASFSRATFRITVEPSITDFKEKLQEIKDAVDRADLPTEAEDPQYFRFNSAQKAIMDIGMYLDGEVLLSTEQRQILQEYALNFKNQLLSLPEVSGVEESGYLKPEIQIEVNPQKLIEYELPVAEVATQVQRQHIRTPLGVMEDEAESEVSLKSYLDDIEPLNNTIISSSFQGRKVLLKDVAEVRRGFERSTAIQKIQGHEAVTLNVQKSPSIGILKAREAVIEFTDKYLKNHEGSKIRISILDDESYSIRNRLSIIATNGLFGFIIILIVLFMFLDLRSGFWVAMGLPFSLAVTLIMCMVLGYTVNNVTLAAVIIVLGIVVDDAIIVADSISKYKERGLKPLEASIQGSSRVILPVLAGVLTTCVAFFPLLNFEGRFGMFVKYIPLVVTLMLLGSLLESFFILPSHLAGMKKMNSSDNEMSKMEARLSKMRSYYLPSLERLYARLLDWVLERRLQVIFSFVLILALSIALFAKEMKFVMFPRESSNEFSVKVIAPEDSTRLQTAQLVTQVEKLFLNDKFQSVVGFRTVIGQNRRGGEVRENEASLRVEVLPPDELPTSFSKMQDYWKAEAAKLTDFKEIRFMENWWGSDAGSPIAIEVLENNDEKRKLISEKLKTELEKISSLKNVEIERPRVKTEFTLNLNQSESMRLDINPSQMAQTLRAFVEGQILYRLYGDEEIDVRLTSSEASKQNIDQILGLRASNAEGYLVPIGNLVQVNEQKKPSNIQRVNFKRANYVYADLADGHELTPLEVANYLEENVFPTLSKESPTTLFNFRGEIEDSRESSSDFSFSILLTVALIYLILIFMFSRLTTPLIIGASIPFGVAGVILAFFCHGLWQFGFFALVGTLGMLGVVINDSIVMLDNFEDEYQKGSFKENLFGTIRDVAVTRLRPVLLTTLTTVAGVFPTAYGLGGYDAMLSDMMLAMGWGLLFGTFITLMFMPIIYSYLIANRMKGEA